MPGGSRQRGWRLATKRTCDALLSGLALLLCSPLLLAVALLVRWRMGGPILFRQTRVGRGGRQFTLLKFRTMTEAAGADGKRLADGERLTGFGRRLRALSLDELPQLCNVLRGELSLVGPRPLLPAYLERYTPQQARRHQVMQGITGWAQIQGRNAISWEEKFALDVWYVEHWSLALDARILCRTLWQLFRREGISSSGHATMPEFMGSDDAAEQSRPHQGD